MNTVTKTRYATLLAAAMHLAGAMGIILGYDQLFATLTPFNLLSMFGLLIWTMPVRSPRFFLFLIFASVTGFVCEVIGVHTGILFGNYSYGQALGWKFWDVPLLIGVNWFVVVYASGMLALQLRHWVSAHLPLPGKAVYSRLLGLSVVIDGALLATLFDWIMEPAAVKLGFWSWEGGQIPLLNYLTWFGVSLVVLLFFNRMKMKPHAFAVNLLLVQAAFFLAVR